MFRGSWLHERQEALSCEHRTRTKGSPGMSKAGGDLFNRLPVSRHLCE